MDVKVFRNGFGVTTVDLSGVPKRPTIKQAEDVMAALSSFTGDAWEIKKVSGRWYVYRSGELLGEQQTTSFELALHRTGELTIIATIPF